MSAYPDLCQIEECNLLIANKVWPMRWHRCLDSSLALRGELRLAWDWFFRVKFGLGTRQRERKLVCRGLVPNQRGHLVRTQQGVARLIADSAWAPRGGLWRGFG